MNFWKAAGIQSLIGNDMDAMDVENELEDLVIEFEAGILEREQRAHGDLGFTVSVCPDDDGKEPISYSVFVKLGTIQRGSNGALRFLDADH